MHDVRPAAVAGTWYPGSATSLAAAVERYVGEASVAAPMAHVAALIAPHAGLMYSGPVAAHAYRQLRGRRVETVVLVGPSHYVDFHGVSVWPRGSFDTPLGPAQIDTTLAAALLRASGVVQELPTAHAREHSLEMHLPFVRHLLPGARIVPLVMGRQTRATIDALADALAETVDPAVTVLVASTDLSHFHDAETAHALDAQVVECVSQFDAGRLQALLDARPEHACGGGPMLAVMRAARRLGASDAAVLDYADSGDVSGDTRSVVGYLAAALGTSA